MIPLHLRLSGFLSYRDPIELDFTTFELACISGPNGAGKSTLLDAITWSLFGQARRRDDSLINLQSKAAEVAFTFRYEQNLYRVQRSLSRGKTPILEFQMHADASVLNASPLAHDTRPTLGSGDSWKPLTERTLRETQAVIERTLRLDYDTFVNASFFLQGRADQFTQQPPGKRKDVLSNILGLGTWETYKTRTTDRRRLLEEELAGTEARLGEIATELDQEVPRRRRLAELEAELSRLTSARKSQEVSLANHRKVAASLAQQRVLIETLAGSLDKSLTRVVELETRLADRQSVRLQSADLARRRPMIESGFQAWQKTVKDLEEWNQAASAFREQEKSRLPLIEKIAAEKARFEEELRGLVLEHREFQSQTASIKNLETELGRARILVGEAETRSAELAQLKAELAARRESVAALKAENGALKTEMDALQQRIQTLQSAEGITCPLCGQPLSPDHRASTLRSLQAEGKARGDQFRANAAAVADGLAMVSQLESKFPLRSGADDERLARSNAVAQLIEKLGTLQRLAADWESSGNQRLTELQENIQNGAFASEEQALLARVDEGLARLGYDVAAHDRVRLTERERRAADEDYRRLQAALAALAPLDNEIHNLEAEIADRRSEIAREQDELKAARSAAEAAGASLPDLEAAERELFDLQEQENRLNQEVGGAHQKVSVLDDLRTRSAELQSSRQSLAIQIGRHRMLERAFGKDGVPALLIEQALPEIEGKANEVLDRLSDGRMSVRFVTQAGYKDRRREDLRETLEIQISDGDGLRDYETYSGGEAFRVNFAIRLALSEVLAGRKGARLQTLVIDEGFGSQDAQGRQRLVEAINLVKKDFAMILIITHLDELKDYFSTRIEVDKTERGSVARVVS